MALHGDNTVINDRMAGGAYAPRIADELPASGTSGVSWGAIFAGAVGAAALSLVLLLLGTGLGMTMVSPWANEGVGFAGVGVATIAWLSFMQLAASGMGGYLAGRLRTKWADLQVDEIYFRDTAHGFLAWAVATLLTAALLGSAMGSIAGAGARAGTQVASAAVQGAGAATVAGAGAMGGAAASSGDATGPMGYFIDTLFRRDTGAPTTPGAPAAPGAGPDAAAPSAAGAMPAPPPPPGANPAASSAEVTRIFARSIRTGALPPEDAKYVAALVAQRTGLSQEQAERRVNDTYAKAQAALRDAEAKAKEAADTARKASAYAALWLVVSLFIGAFVASLAATWGGRRRDM